MGFHKRYIDDEQIISLYCKGGADNIIEWYTRGVDAVILSGILSQEIGVLIDQLPHNDNSIRDEFASKINNYQST